jgi:hypothetical protein
VRDRNDALKLVPVVHLNQNLEQPGIEVVLQHVLLFMSAFLALGIFLIFCLRRLAFVLIGEV